MKKFLTLLTVVALTIVTMTHNIVGVVAEEQPTSQIYITNNMTNTGINLEGKTFKVYKVFDASISNDADAATITYTWTDAFKVLFNNLGYTEEKDAEDYIHNAYTNSQMQDVVREMEEFVKTDSVAEIDSISGTVNVIDGVQTMASSELAPGYYLILDESTNGSVKSAGMLVSIPVKVADKDDENIFDFIGDAYIELKGSQPKIEKKIWHNDANTNGDWDSVGDYEIGDKVDFFITVKVPKDLTGYEPMDPDNPKDTDYTFSITDTMSEGLTFDKESLKLYLDKELQKEAEGNHHKTTFYENDADNKVFTLTFDVLAIKEALPTQEEFYIVYSATLNDKALVANDKEKNTIKLEYSNNPYDPSSKGESESEVYAYSFELDVLKTDTTGVRPLKGAVFQLFEKNLIEGEEPHPVYLEKGELDADGSRVYIVKQKGTHDLGTRAGYVETEENGKFSIKGLDDKKTYILKEVIAPEGYSTAKDLIFEIEATYDSEGNLTGLNAKNEKIKYEADGSLSTTVINTSDSLFPGTGGMGTTLFVLAGCFMMALAGVIYVMGMKKEIRHK